MSESIYNESLMQRLEAYLAEGHTQADTAKAMSLSGGLLSAYRSKKYKGSIENVEATIAEFFRILDAGQAVAEKAAPYQPLREYIPTSVSEDVYHMINYCQLERGMVILYGDAGIGKTKGAQQYALDNPNTAIYLQASPTFGSLGTFLKILAKALRLPETRSKLDLVMGIRDKLDGTNRVLIIDEAQHLKLSALEELRTLSDPNMITGKPGIGIVLIGNSEVYDRMLGKQEARFAQLFSRVRLNRLYTTRGITKEDVKKLFPRLAEPDKQKELEFVHSVSQSKWGVRGAANVYNNSVNNEDISYKGLLTMARTMGIGLL